MHEESRLFQRMDKKSQRRKKIICLLKDLALSQASVPDIVGDFILSEYGLSDERGEDYYDDDLNEIVSELEKAIGGKPKTEDERSSTVAESRMQFKKACESYEDAKRDYLNVTLKLTALLNEISQYREKYSEHLKQKSQLHQDELEVLETKLQFLKLQSFMKFYSEKNAFPAHTRLKQILSERLDKLKSRNSELIELDAKYSELKNSPAYNDLLQTYKKLLLKEKKIDYMIEK
ncbi:UNVERIFIED_CONTAM: hypothetical protein PYX00_009668 [Menopon gallinae]|uniref:Uncharacterized protein n=1 Tax=Menopon gallinae TaxID=328185 RepID=A0AAW2HC77_9NEOP